MSSWIAIEAIVATSHPVEKYGGVAASLEVLRQIAEGISAGALPMIGHHDWTRPVRTRDVVATVVDLDDGEIGVRLTGLVNEDDWDAIGKAVNFSFTASQKIRCASSGNVGTSPLGLSADAGWFDDEAISEASALMSEVGPVDASRLYQFDAFDVARIVLDIGYNLVGSLGPNLAASAIWDGLKYLLARRKIRVSRETTPSRIELHTDLDSGKVIGIIDSSSEDVVKEALATYYKTVEAAASARRGTRTVAVWTPVDGKGWVRSEDRKD